MARRDKSKVGQLPAELAQAHALWRQLRYDEAIRKFNEAVRQAPNNFCVLIEASRALGARYQFDRSLSLVARALRLGARRYDVQHAAGVVYWLLGRVAEAEACFRRACRLASHPESQLELAKICERRHALDEAEELVTRALRGNAGLGAALMLLARIQRRRGETELALTTLRRLTAIALAPAIAAEAYGELCTLLDGAGQYDEAWGAALKCKQVLLAHDQAAWAAAEFVLGRAGRMVAALTGEDFSRWRGTERLDSEHRLALLTGFPRSGTTLLEQVIEAHPAVVSAEEKELFSDEIFPWLGAGRPPDVPIIGVLDELTPTRIREARQKYVSAMQGMLGEPIGARLLLDKNPAMNLMIPPMRRVFPELKLVIALRDPRDVIVSCFLRYLPINPVSVGFLTLERTVERYALDMGAWLKMRDMIDDWVEIRYEDAIADLPREARHALSALDLPWDDAVLEYRQRAEQKQVRSPTYEAVAKPIFTTARGRWRNYERQLAPLANRLSPLIKALGYEA